MKQLSKLRLSILLMDIIAIATSLLINTYMPILNFYYILQGTNS